MGAGAANAAGRREDLVADQPEVEKHPGAPARAGAIIGAAAAAADAERVAIVDAAHIGNSSSSGATIR